MVKVWDKEKGEYEEPDAGGGTATIAPPEPRSSEPRKLFAHDAASAWLNAAIACGQDETRHALYRTLRVEFFKAGVQFVGCDGTMLFRTWACYSEGGDITLPQPESEKLPIDAVTVLDDDKFALAFMRTLLAATAGENAQILELTMTIDPVDGEQAALGSAVEKYVLNLDALGQRLSCKLWDGQYPDWRALKLGIDAGELVDGMTIAPRLFKSVGQLKGVSGVDCTFRGETRAIDIRGVHGSVPFAGLLMPMQRPTDRQKPAAEPAPSEQIEHEGGES